VQSNSPINRFFHLLIFGKIRPKIATSIIGETGRILVFPVFSVPLLSPVRFGRFFPNFADFFRIFQKPTESVRSDFPPFTEFSNTGHDYSRCHARKAKQIPTKSSPIMGRASQPARLIFFVFFIFLEMNPIKTYFQYLILFNSRSSS
jgi:hypothetical protein